MNEMINVPELFGSLVFNEDVMKERLPAEVYESLLNTIEAGKEIDASIADVVAAAMKDWAIEHGATHFTHWFQPLTGVTAEKHDAFLTPAPHGKAIMEFSGKVLIKGEPDASSFPTGGLRATFEARGYTAWDPASYAFVKDGSLYIPTAFCSYTGEALDTKTPLLRSMDVIGKEGLRIVKLFGDDTARRVTTTVGAEQEYFLIKDEHFKARRDLFYCGRTLFGAPAVKGQDLDDHYFGTIPAKVGEYMHELDMELWRLGISAKTKHNETAPAQHELAPVFETTNIGTDHNLLMMECMKRLAPKYGMACLLSEKPFAGINGSGKHNNWSLGTDTGRNLLKPGKTPETNKMFLLMLAAVIEAVDDYQDLLRISAATAGNDSRLGGHEAPPAIVSMFLGDELDALVNSIVTGGEFHKVGKKYMSLGTDTVPAIRRDNADRNRTSPFAFTGNKFEFRMVGSSQNIALANTVLNTAVAKSFKRFADVLETSNDFDADVDKLIKETISAHSRIIFSGNSYTHEWEEEACRRGLSNFRTAPEAYAHLNDPKNVALFEEFGVMSRTELLSRREIYFSNYRKIKNIEAKTMLEMSIRDYIPAVSKYIGDLSAQLNVASLAVPEKSLAEMRKHISTLAEHLSAVYTVREKLDGLQSRAAAIASAEEAAFFYKDNVNEVMQELRSHVDALEVITAREYWPVPTYGDMTYGGIL